MTISSRVQQQFFASSDPSTPHEIIRLPLTLLDQIDYWSMAPQMTTTFGSSSCDTTRHSSAPKRRSNLWTAQEHDRFLRGLELFPQGPWRRIAAVVRTKTTRQTMTHAQKYRQKIKRHQQVTTAVMNVVCASNVPRPSEITINRVDNEPYVCRASDDSMLTYGFECLESDAALKALINSLDPIDNPDAWSIHVDPTEWRKSY